MQENFQLWRTERGETLEYGNSEIARGPHATRHLLSLALHADFPEISAGHETVKKQPDGLQGKSEANSMRKCQK